VTTHNIGQVALNSARAMAATMELRNKISTITVETGRCAPNMARLEVLAESASRAAGDLTAMLATVATQARSGDV
jgi:hypothetical protein